MVYCFIIFQSVKIMQSSLECRSSEHSSNAPSHGIDEENDQHRSRPRTIPANGKYLRALLSTERQGVAALRSVVDMLKKSTNESMRTIAKYRFHMDQANMIEKSS